MNHVCVVDRCRLGDGGYYSVDPTRPKIAPYNIPRAVPEARARISPIQTCISGSLVTSSRFGYLPEPLKRMGKQKWLTISNYSLRPFSCGENVCCRATREAQAAYLRSLQAKETGGYISGRHTLSDPTTAQRCDGGNPCRRCTKSRSAHL